MPNTTEADTIERPFPRAALAGAGFLVASALTAAVLASVYDIGASRMTLAPTIQSRELLFSDMENGSVHVQEAGTLNEVAVLAPGKNGFVRVVLHGLARDRNLAGIGADVPFKLSRFADGRTLIEDPATGRSVSLGGFGSDNGRAFAQLLREQK